VIKESGRAKVGYYKMAHTVKYLDGKLKISSPQRIGMRKRPFLGPFGSSVLNPWHWHQPLRIQGGRISVHGY
jgi:hypothetical protein